MKEMDYNTLPVGLGLAFATNRAAMDRFVDMTDDEKKEFVERSRGVMSRKEMDSLVSSLTEDEEPDLHLEDVDQIAFRRLCSQLFHENLRSFLCGYNCPTKCITS